MTDGDYVCEKLPAAGRSVTVDGFGRNVETASGIQTRLVRLEDETVTVEGWRCG